MASRAEAGAVHVALRGLEVLASRELLERRDGDADCQRGLAEVQLPCGARLRLNSSGAFSIWRGRARPCLDLTSERLAEHEGTHEAIEGMAMPRIKARLASILTAWSQRFRDYRLMRCVIRPHTVTICSELIPSSQIGEATRRAGGRPSRIVEESDVD